MQSFAGSSPVRSPRASSRSCSDSRAADTGAMLGWYDAIVESVTGVAAGNPPTPAGAAAFDQLRETVEPALESAGDLDSDRDRLERRRDDVRRHRDDGGDDREPRLASADVRWRAVGERTRGVIAPRAGSRGHRSLRDARRGARGRSRSARATSSRSPSRARTAIRRTSPTLTASTCDARTRSTTSRSRTGHTCASGMHLARLEALTAVEQPVRAARRPSPRP